MQTATDRTLLMPALHTGGQVDIFTSKARFKVLAAGAQWGKSMLASAAAVSTAANGGHVWWIFPDYPLASIGWDYLTGLCKQIPFCTIHPGEHLVRFTSGGFVQIKSTGQLLRGRPLDLAIFDEAAFCPEDSWQKEVAPRLSTRLGRAMFISTPNGFNWFQRLWEKGNEPDAIDWQSWQLPTAANPFIAPSEIESARGRLHDSAFRQEYLADFVALTGAVFPMFRRERHVKPITVDDHLPIHVGIDFGFRSFAAVLFQVTSAGEVHVIGEMETHETTTEAAARQLVSMPYGNGKPFALRLGTIGCDPAGGARNLQTGYSDVQVLHRVLPNVRVRYSTVDEHRSPEWRAARVRDLLLAADGTVRLFVDPSCRGVIRMLENSVYPEHKEGREEKAEPVKDGVYEHLRDALGYGLVNAGVLEPIGPATRKVAWL